MNVRIETLFKQYSVNCNRNRYCNNKNKDRNYHSNDRLSQEQIIITENDAIRKDEFRHASTSIIFDLGQKLRNSKFAGYTIEAFLGCCRENTSAQFCSLNDILTTILALGPNLGKVGTKLYRPLGSVIDDVK